VNEAAFETAEALRERSLYAEALPFYRKALKGSRGAERLACLTAIGDTCRMVGDFLSSGKYYSSAVELAERTGDVAASLDAAVGLGLSRRALGDWKSALRLLTRAEGGYRKLRDREGLAFALWARAGALRIKGDIPEAVRTFRAALRAFTSLGSDRGIGYCLTGLGGTTRVRGLFGESLRHYSAANELFRQTRDSFGMAYSHCGIGNALRMQGDMEGARRHFRRAIALYRRMGDVVSYSYTLWSMGKTYLMLGKPGVAGRYFRDSLALFEKTRDPRGAIYSKMGLSEKDFLEGRPKEAKRKALWALGEAGSHGFKVEWCHARGLAALLEGKAAPGCYRGLGLRLAFKSIPMNIP
jgi:tetratricopeptide (TPR) repeat protein